MRKGIPEIVWIALLHKAYGETHGVRLATLLARSARSITEERRNHAFCSMSEFSSLSEEDFASVRPRLVADGSLFTFQRGFENLVRLYPACPLRGLFANLVDDSRDESATRSVAAAVRDLYDRTSRFSMLVQASFLLLGFDAGILFVQEGLSLARMPVIEEYPLTEESKRVASSIRGTVTMLLGQEKFSPSSEWPAYFWNRGLEIDDCQFGAQDE